MIGGALIIRPITIIRTNNPNNLRTLLDLAGKNGIGNHADPRVVRSIPRGSGGHVKVYFFRPNRYVNNHQLMREYARHGLKPDPLAQFQANLASPSFIDHHRNGSLWRDNRGRWCYMTFLPWFDGRWLMIDRVFRDWGPDWWFAGTPK